MGNVVYVWSDALAIAATTSLPPETPPPWRLCIVILPGSNIASSRKRWTLTTLCPTSSTGQVSGCPDAGTKFRSRSPPDPARDPGGSPWAGLKSPEREIARSYSQGSCAQGPGPAKFLGVRDQVRLNSWVSEPSISAFYQPLRLQSALSISALYQRLPSAPSTRLLSAPSTLPSDTCTKYARKGINFSVKEDTHWATAGGLSNERRPPKKGRKALGT
eukprot:gene25554-biopygen15045